MIAKLHKWLQSFWPAGNKLEPDFLETYFWKEKKLLKDYLNNPRKNMIRSRTSIKGYWAVKLHQTCTLYNGDPLKLPICEFSNKHLKPFADSQIKRQCCNFSIMLNFQTSINIWYDNCLLSWCNFIDWIDAFDCVPLEQPFNVLSITAE